MSVVQTVEAEVDQPIVPVPPVGRQAKPEQSPAKYVNPNEMITVPKGAISMQSKLRHRLANSTIARGAAFPLRTMIVARYDAHVIGRSVDWLVHGRETTNFTYDLDPLNRDQLSWFVSAVSGAEIGPVRAWMQELEDDAQLFDHLTRRLSSGPRRGISAKEPHWARRLGWYALVRAAQPDHVIETGTHLGLGSCAIAAALLRNGHGRLTTIDIDPEAGYLIGEPWANVIDRRTGDSIEVLAGREGRGHFPPRQPSHLRLRDQRTLSGRTESARRRDHSLGQCP